MNETTLGTGEREEHLAHEAEEDMLHTEHMREEDELHREHIQEEEALHEAHEHEEDEAHEREEEREHHTLVRITVDETTVEVERGTYTVAALKGFGNVAQGYNLLREIDGKLALLADDASVAIEGSEVFISRVKSGGSA